MADPRLPDPDLRAADVDRQAVAAALGRHLSDGRLTVEEYDERLARAYAARTYGDLRALTADLPAGTPTRQAPRRCPGPSRRTGPPAAPATGGRHGPPGRPGSPRPSS